VASAAAFVNDYYDYVPSVGAALGLRAHDQASYVQVARRLAQAPTPVPVAPPVPVRGLVEQVRIAGLVSRFHARPAQVYLPPTWFRTPRPALPVIELLHGTPGTPEDWTRAGLADVIADRWAAAHRGWAPIIVMPDINGSFTADTECVDGRLGRAETYLTVDVPDWVERNLGAARARTAWAVAGSSEGGYCALDLSLRHRDRWATFVDIAGLDRPTRRGGAVRLPGSAREVERHTPAWLLARPSSTLPLAGWFAVGTADGQNERATVAMFRLARAHGIPCRLVLLPDAHHTWREFRHSFADAFPWVATRLGGVASV